MKDKIDLMKILQEQWESNFQAMVEMSERSGKTARRKHKALRAKEKKLNLKIAELREEIEGIRDVMVCPIQAVFDCSVCTGWYKHKEARRHNRAGYPIADRYVQCEESEAVRRCPYKDTFKGYHFDSIGDVHNNYKEGQWMFR